MEIVKICLQEKIFLVFLGEKNDVLLVTTYVCGEKLNTCIFYKKFLNRKVGSRNGKLCEL